MGAAGSGELHVRRIAAGDQEGSAAVADLLERSPASVAQQTPAWRDVVAPLGPDEAVYLACERSDRIVGVLPAYRFDGPHGAILVSACQAGALGGVACAPDAPSEEVYRVLLEDFRRLAVESGCAVATVLTNPFQPDREPCRRWLRPEYVLENTCQVLDLESAVGAQGELLEASANARRNLKSAEAAGLFLDEEQSAENVEGLYAIHVERQREIGVQPLPSALFRGALERMVPAGKARFFFVRSGRDGDALVAGGVYLLHGRVIDSLMPSFRSSHAKLSPSFLLAAASIRWARARGLRFYNWQGSPPGGSGGGVRRFKLQWGGSDRTYAFLSAVTGDVSALRRAGPARVRAAYRWHYVLPFDKLDARPAADAGPIESTREASWEAGGGEG